MVLDTNIPILLAKGLFHLDSEIVRILPQKHKIVFLSACMKELDYLAQRNPKLVREVSFAKQLITKYEILDYDPTEIRTTDSKIVEFALENKNNSIIVTNDNGLRKRLRKNNLPVIFIKTHGHLELVGNITF